MLLTCANAWLRGGGGMHREDLPLVIAGLTKVIAAAELAAINEIEDNTERNAALTARQHARRV